MQETEAAILKTLLYADVFNFPLTVEEIHHFLIADLPVSLAAVKHSLDTSPTLKRLLCTSGTYYALAERSSLIHVREEREVVAQALFPHAQRYGIWLARLPFVRMVSLTGALAMRNPSDAHDDLDYFIVTLPGRVWLARALAVAVVKLVQRRGIVICPNYVVATDALAQKRCDLFIAHEVVQMMPLFGDAIYTQLRQQNIWVEQQLPNAVSTFQPVEFVQLGSFWGNLKRGLEVLLSGKVGDRLEKWEHQRKLRRFAPQAAHPHSDAQLDNSQVKGHFNDHGRRILDSYCDRLRQYGLLEDQSLRATGD